MTGVRRVTQGGETKLGLSSSFLIFVRQGTWTCAAIGASTLSDCKCQYPSHNTSRCQASASVIGRFAMQWRRVFGGVAQSYGAWHNNIATAFHDDYDPTIPVPVPSSSQPHRRLGINGAKAVAQCVSPKATNRSEPDSTRHELNVSGTNLVTIGSARAHVWSSWKGPRAEPRRFGTSAVGRLVVVVEASTGPRGWASPVVPPLASPGHVPTLNPRGGA